MYYLQVIMKETRKGTKKLLEKIRKFSMQLMKKSNIKLQTENIMREKIPFTIPTK